MELSMSCGEEEQCATSVAESRVERPQIHREELRKGRAAGGGNGMKGKTSGWKCSCSMKLLLFFFGFLGVWRYGGRWMDLF